MSVKMKWASLCGLTLSALLLTGCLCKDTEEGLVASPNGRYVARLYVRDCGATTSPYTHVVLRSSGAHLLGPNDNDFVFTVKYDPVIKIQWKDDSHLAISYSSDPHNVLLAKERWEGIEISSSETKE